MHACMHACKKPLGSFIMHACSRALRTHACMAGKREGCAIRQGHSMRTKSAASEDACGGLRPARPGRLLPRSTRGALALGGELASRSHQAVGAGPRAGRQCRGPRQAEHHFRQAPR